MVSTTDRCTCDNSRLTVWHTRYPFNKLIPCRMIGPIAISTFAGTSASFGSQIQIVKSTTELQLWRLVMAVRYGSSMILLALSTPS
jgi:hypothetical protein